MSNFSNEPAKEAMNKPKNENPYIIPEKETLT
jgi:hypothetical protein